MAFVANDYGMSKGAPGLLVPNQPFTSETGNLQEDVNSEGGFAVYGVKGEGEKCYAQKPEGGYFKGIVQRMVHKDCYAKGDIVTVISKGWIEVQVATDVLSGSEVFVNDEGKFADSGTKIENAMYKTNTSEDGIAVVALA